MKRLISFILVLISLMVLCACNKVEEQSIEESVAPVEKVPVIEEPEKPLFQTKEVEIISEGQKLISLEKTELSGDNPGLYNPSDNYTKLFPFIGGYADWVPGPYGGALYGLTDKDGNIALPASAMDIWVYEAGDTAFYWLTMQVSQARFDELAALGKGSVSRHLLVREDGKKYIEFDIATDIEVMEDRIVVSYDISESNYEEIVIDIYDTELNLIKRITNGKGIGEYSEGLLAIYTNDGGYYINKEGEMQFSVYDYSYLGGFNQGLACVGAEKYGFINMEGELVIPMDYMDATDFLEGGHAGVNKTQRSNQRRGQVCSAFINKNGEVVHEAPEGKTYYWRSITKDSVEQTDGHNISSYDFNTFTCPVCQKSGPDSGITQMLYDSKAVYCHNECSGDRFILYDIEGNIIAEYPLPADRNFVYMDEAVAVAYKYNGESNGAILLNSNSVYIVGSNIQKYTDNIYVFNNIVINSELDRAISSANMYWQEAVNCGYSHIGNMDGGKSFVYDEGLNPILQFTW